MADNSRHHVTDTVKHHNKTSNQKQTSAHAQPKDSLKSKHKSNKPPKNKGDILINAKFGEYLESNSTWWIMFCMVCVLTLVTRLYKIAEPAHVCWDETHFGKMGSMYINKTFFFDVHPPLGKMSIGWAGMLTGYNGTFPFAKPGDKYGDTPYIGMRVFCVLLGSATIPLAYMCVWELTHSVSAAIFATNLLIFDPGQITISQYILLDPILIFFIMLSAASMLKFNNLADRPFTFVWWFWMSATGAALACAMSVKFVGLFIVLLAGYTTVIQLWNLLGDLNLSMVLVIKHLLARVLCLIVLPVSIYIVFFAIHFQTLSKSGSGDGFYSSAFQSQLEGNPLHKAHMPEVVAFGSEVSIKQHRTGGAYLHSHWHLYPEGHGARQQQVTTYSHKDENNMWLIKRFDVNPHKTQSAEHIKHGDMVRLEHAVTHRNLHSHREMAPITRLHYQVTCYGENGTGDANDIFKVLIQGGQNGDNLRTVKSVFQLLHIGTGCALQSHNVQLPKWGWEQMEVTCNPNTRDHRTYWNIEEVHDERLPKSSFEVYAPSFIQKLVESHAVMFQGNSGLKPKEGELTSQPWQWPINYRGQHFSGGEMRIYLLGNPVIWWGNLVIMCVYIVLHGIHAVKARRGYVEDDKHTGDKTITFSACSWLLLGWALHYLPFWNMGRVLYFHHYFPAHMFSTMLSGIMLDYLIRFTVKLFKTSSFMIHHTATGIIFSVLLYSFYLFHPFCYGIIEENEKVINMPPKWLESWDL